MRCCRKVRAYVGYTQGGEWCVVMVSGERILCECHPHAVGFCRKPPFSLEEWIGEWRRCGQTFFRGRDVVVRWEEDLPRLLSDKASKVVWGYV